MSTLHDPTPSPSPITPHPSRITGQLLLLMALSGLLFFLGLGDMGLTDRDEGRNAEAGREMFQSGDRLTPTFNGELRVAKPVFLYWLMDQSYRLFGVSEFAARFPSALFGVGLILITYLFLLHQRDRTVALFGALMLLLNLEILGLGRMALTDSVLIFFTTASLYGFWLGLHGEGRMRHWIWTFYVGMALATLTKGPVGFAVPLIAAALYLTWTRRWQDYWHNGFTWRACWCLLSWLLLGMRPCSSSMAMPMPQAPKPIRSADFSVRWKAIMGPSSSISRSCSWAFSLGARSFLSRSITHSKTGERREARGERTQYIRPLAPRPSSLLELELFAAIWVVGVFLFFTASSTRLPHYIGPLFPAAALLAASYWSRCLQDPTTKGIRGSIHLMMGLGYLLAIAFACVPTLYANYASKMVREFPLAGQVGLGIGPYVAATLLLFGMGLVGYLGLNEERRGGAFWAAGATLAGLVLTVIVIATPTINRFVIAPPQELAYAAGLNLDPQDLFIAYGTVRPSSVFYARRPTVFVPFGEEDKIREALKGPKKVMILLPETAQAKLPAEAVTLVPILKRYGYILLAKQPMVTIPEGAAPPPPPTVFGH